MRSYIYTVCLYYTSMYGYEEPKTVSWKNSDCVYRSWKVTSEALAAPSSWQHQHNNSSSIHWPWISKSEPVLCQWRAEKQVHLNAPFQEAHPSFAPLLFHSASFLVCNLHRAMNFLRVAVLALGDWLSAITWSESQAPSQPDMLCIFFAPGRRSFRRTDG